MANRADYRTELKNKLRDAADNLGKFEFSTTELDEMLANAPRRLYPNLYKLTEDGTLRSADSKGRVDLSGAGYTADAVTRVWDEDDILVTGWGSRGATKLTGFSENQQSLAVERMAPYTMPSNDTSTVDIPDEWRDATVLQAGIDGLERLGADRTDFKGYQPSGESGVDENEVINLMDIWQSQLDRLIQQKGLVLPPWSS